MLDLDDFKRVNDVYSHATGDEVLSEVAEILLRSVRSGDSVCRIGGEEFAIIAPSSGLAEAYRLAERVQEQIARATFGPVGSVSLSIGIAVGARARGEPARARRLRRGRDDDREDARSGRRSSSSRTGPSNAPPSSTSTGAPRSARSRT